MILMGIDQSLTGTGVSFLGSIEKYFLLESGKTKGTKIPSIDYTRRIREITQELKDLIVEYNPDIICIEGMSFGSKSAVVFDLGGLSHLIRSMLMDLKKDFIVIPPKTLKKYFTGSGNADKIAMITECQNRGANIPFFKNIKKQKVFDDNVSDSYALASFAKDYINNTCIEFLDKIEVFHA